MAKAIFNETYMKFSVSDIFNSNPPSYPPLLELNLLSPQTPPKNKYLAQTLLLSDLKTTY